MKKNNPNKKQRSVTKVCDLYRDLFTFREQPIMKASIDRLMEEALKEAVDNPNMLTVTQYFRKKGVAESTLRSWRKKYPDVHERYQELKSAVADNREVGGLTNKLNPAMVTYSMPLYSKQWQALMERKAELKKQAKEENQQGLKVIVMEKFPESPLVPSKVPRENDKE